MSESKEILQMINEYGLISSKIIAQKLLHISLRNIQKTVHRLLSESKIMRVGEIINNGKNPVHFLYANTNEGMQYKPLTENESIEITKVINAPHKDRKIELLKIMISNSCDTRKDLLIGMLADYQGTN